MSKHRDDVQIDLPAIFGSRAHVGQVVAVEAEHDHIQISVTQAAAAELARILVQYGSAVRMEKAAAPSPSSNYDPDLWHDVGLALNAAADATTAAGVSRYVDPRHPSATGRRRKSTTPLVLVGGDQ